MVEYPRSITANSKIGRDESEVVGDLIAQSVKSIDKNAFSQFCAAVFHSLGKSAGRDYLSFLLNTGYKSRLYYLHARYCKALSSKECAVAFNVSTRAAQQSWLKVEVKLVTYQSYVQHGILLAPIMNLLGISRISIYRDLAGEPLHRLGMVNLDKPYDTSGCQDIPVSSRQLALGWSRGKYLGEWRQRRVKDGLELLSDLSTRTGKDLLDESESGIHPRCALSAEEESLKTHLLHISDKNGNTVVSFHFDPARGLSARQVEMLVELSRQDTV